MWWPLYHWGVGAIRFSVGCISVIFVVKKNWTLWGQYEMIPQKAINVENYIKNVQLVNVFA